MLKPEILLIPSFLHTNLYPIFISFNNPISSYHLWSIYPLLFHFFISLFHSISALHPSLSHCLSLHSLTHSHSLSLPLTTLTPPHYPHFFSHSHSLSLSVTAAVGVRCPQQEQHRPRQNPL